MSRSIAVVKVNRWDAERGLESCFTVRNLVEPGTACAGSFRVWPDGHRAVASLTPARFGEQVS